MKTGLIALVLMIQCTAFAQETSPVQADVPISVGYSDTAIVEFPDVAPEFNGGMDSLKAYLDRNLIYPKDALLYGLEGKVYMSFVVERDGRLTNIRVERGAHPPLDAEARRLIEFMPPWKPGQQQHKAVRTRARLPINFTMD